MAMPERRIFEVQPIKAMPARFAFAAEGQSGLDGDVFEIPCAGCEALVG